MAAFFSGNCGERGDAYGLPAPRSATRARHAHGEWNRLRADYRRRSNPSPVANAASFATPGQRIDDPRMAKDAEHAEPSVRDRVRVAQHDARDSAAEKSDRQTKQCGRRARVRARDWRGHSFCACREKAIRHADRRKSERVANVPRCRRRLPTRRRAPSASRPRRLSPSRPRPELPPRPSRRPRPSPWPQRGQLRARRRPP